MRSAVNRRLPQRQKGAALFIALIVLLVITLLALSSIREVTLESRVTGNFVEQQKLLNFAEAGLREGEGQVTQPLKPLEAASTCTSTLPCLLADNPTYAQLFDTTGKHRAYAPADNTTLPSDSTVEWYALMAPAGSESGEAENPEYGNMMQGIGTFRYEVNARTTNTKTQRTTNLRSTTAKVFN
ncbi:PilX N-terminal domain-containing pilus assembly protein [Pseudomonas sp. RIT-PI-AD]|uniref:pilus assembly PilX family protein n=1 Tax=Pseudomonas sp. RIT-PI-AD TaxID=3035294 RepID=UPI0021D9D75C|nr:PilX N-terminal domain-containing pilus assembly protein [Pseudomonas sp. RIT-PI-AD]